MQPSFVMSVPPMGALNMRFLNVVLPRVMGLQRFGYLRRIGSPVCIDLILL